VEAKSDMLRELQDELKRVQTKLETSVSMEMNDKLKEQMDFWQDSTKKSLHHEVGQLGKESKIKVTKLEKQFNEIEQVVETMKTDIKNSNRKMESKLEELKDHLQSVE